MKTLQKYIITNLENLKIFNWSLFVSLCVLAFIPAIQETVKTSLLSFFGDIGVFDIIGQMEWFDLINETLQAFLIIPLYSILNKVIFHNHEEFSENVFKCGIVTFSVYTLFSVGILLYGSVLLSAMNPVDINLSAASIYLMLETVAFIVGIVASFDNIIFVLVGKAQNIYIFLVIRTVMLVITDFLLIPKMSIYGVAVSNIIVNIILAIASTVLLYKQNQIKPCRFCRKDYLMFRKWGKVGFFSGLQQFIDNLIYAVMICKMVNMVSEQGNYWNANNFIWGWLLIPILALAEVIRRDCGEGYHKLKKFNYYFVAVCTILLWGITIPLWKPFFIHIEGLTNADVVLEITIKLIPFYIAYVGSAIIDNIFVGLGKTQYNMANSLIINIGYYGIFYLFYITEKIKFTMDSIILMFGIGMVVHLIVSLIEEMCFLRNKEIKSSVTNP